MHHPDTTPTAFGGVADKLTQSLTGLVTSQAMQIDLPLQAPMPFAQLLGDIGAYALAAVAEFVIGVQQGLDIKVVAQAFAQHIDVIQALLLG